MADLASVQLIVSGRVQGVYFRDFTHRRARELGLTGYVRNLQDRNAVEVVAEGKRSQLEKLIDYVKVGPPAARVEKLDTMWSAFTGSYPEFSIRN